MGPAPLPPHERAWRHPSELAPSKADLEEPTGGGRAFVLASGVSLLMLAAVMAVALTPPKSNAPTAMSATTLPSVTVQLRSAPVQDLDPGATARNTGTVMIDHNTMSRDNALALVGAPNAVSAAPASPSGLDVGQQLPDAAERVYLLTRSHTYSVVWSLIDRVKAPDGSAVVTIEGELVASFEDGELRILVD